MDIDQPVEAYAASMGFVYTVPTAAEAAARAHNDQASFNNFISAARTAMAGKDYPRAADNYLQASYYPGHLTIEDRLQAARAISLGEHENVRDGVYFLFQAVLLGYNEPQRLLETDDYAYLKANSTLNWEELAAMVERISRSE